MSVALRPTFTRELPFSPGEVLARLEAHRAAEPSSLRTTRVPGGGSAAVGARASGEAGASERGDGHFVLTVPEAERHFWSPWLWIEVTPRGDGAHLFGRFSPHPSVWSAFVFGYLALAVLGSFALIFALSLWLSGGSPWTLWIAAACGLGMALLWWSSQVGQRLAHAQMAALHAELDEALGSGGAG